MMKQLCSANQSVWNASDSELSECQITTDFNNNVEAMAQNRIDNGDKIIIVDFQKSSTGVSFTVKDEGNGFDHSAIPDIKDDGKEKTFPGRGIFLIKSLSDSVTFNKEGNEIAIGFKTAGINIEMAADRAQKFKVYKDSKQKIEK